MESLSPDRPLQGRVEQGAWVTALAVALALMGACRDPSGLEKSSPEPEKRPSLRTVLVADLTLPDKRPEDLSLVVDGELRRALLGPENFRPVVGTDLSACTAEFDVVYALIVNGSPVAEAPQGVARMAMEGRVRCLPPGGDDDVPEMFSVDLMEERDFGEGAPLDGKATLRELAAQMARRAADVAYGQVVMRHASDDHVLEVLKTSQHEGLLIEAASESGERRLLAAVDPLVARTRDPRDHVRLRAGAALGLLGDDRSQVIQALAAMTRGSDPEPLLMAIHALGDIGGAEAARYLESIADSHPLAPVREAARGSLERSRAR